MPSKLTDEFKEFWSPVVIALGVTIGLNSIDVSLKSITINGWNGWFNLSFGVAFIVLGILIRPGLNWKWWTRTAITSGIAGFFFGVHLANNHIFYWGWGIIIVTLILVFGGFFKARAQFLKRIPKK